jgi:GNAT superfamily N-acetyltransferase
MPRMGARISIHLDDDVRAELKAQAQARGIGLAALLRDVATRAARAAQRARIRQTSEAIGRRVAGNAEARAFYQEIGTPTTDAG